MSDAALTTQPAAEDGRDATADPGTRIFKGSLFRTRTGRAWAFTTEPPPQVRRPARVAQVLARAHRLQAAIDRGDRADAARQLGFTRARITQILAVLLLALDTQERVLKLEAVDGREPMSERALRADREARGVGRPAPRLARRLARLRPVSLSATLQASDVRTCVARAIMANLGLRGWVAG